MLRVVRTWQGRDLRSEVFERARRVGQRLNLPPKAWRVSRYRFEAEDLVEGRLARKPCILRVVGSDALPWRAIPLVQLHLKVLIQKCSILWIKTRQPGLLFQGSGLWPKDYSPNPDA